MSQADPITLSTALSNGHTANGSASAPLKDPTAAERARRYRARQAERRATVTAPAAVRTATRARISPTTLDGAVPPATITPAVTSVTRPASDGLARSITPTVTPAPSVTPATASDAAPDRIVTLATLASALALATCSAAFSIYGITSVFVGAFWPVVGMGVALELGKLSAVAQLGRRRGDAALRCALIVLVGVLMVLNTIGVYGYLNRARLAQVVTAAARVDGKAADVKARIEVQQGIVADLDRRIGQLDATGRGYTRTAMRLVNDQASRRADLERQREEAAGQLAQIELEQASVNSERQAADADLTPVRYLATLLGSTDEATMPWFILTVALLLDPAAVLLLFAAARETKPALPRRNQKCQSLRTHSLLARFVVAHAR